MKSFLKKSALCSASCLQALSVTGMAVGAIALAAPAAAQDYTRGVLAGTVVDAIVRVGLDTDVPVLSAVLTPHNFQESEAHIAFFRDHFVIKGKEAAHAARQIIDARAKAAMVAA